MTRREKLQELLAQDPNDSFTRYAIGLEFAKEKNFEEAIRVLTELIKADPEYIPSYYMLASYYRETEARDEALATYKLGIAKARSVRDLHAASELEAALDELEDEM
jgi:predicted Zn-dependent protease